MNFFQSMPFHIIMLVVGFVFLIKGADFFVEGSSGIAKKLRIPSLIIGMTIVAMGTSLPELAVSLTASIANNNELAVSNVIGSNLFNLLVVIGFCAVIKAVPVKRETIKKDFPIFVLATVLLLILGLIGMALGHVDGVIFLVCFVLFLVNMVRSAIRARTQERVAEIRDKTQEHAADIRDKTQERAVDIRDKTASSDSMKKLSGTPENEEDSKPIPPVWKCIIFMIIGVIGIILGGDWVVDSASAIAATFGLSQNLIGLTIVAIGTSLPELVTSVVAAKKGEVQLALGNALGSNIFNILMILGISATISPIGFNMENVIDLIILIGCSALTWLFAKTQGEIRRKEGLVMIALYAVDMVYICMR